MQLNQFMKQNRDDWRNLEKLIKLIQSKKRSRNDRFVSTNLSKGSKAVVV